MVKRGSITVFLALTLGLILSLLSSDSSQQEWLRPELRF